MQSNNKTTNKWEVINLVLITLFLLVVPMILDILFFGEANLFGLNYLVAINGKRWGLIEKDKNGQVIAQPHNGFGKSNFISVSWEPFVFAIAILILCFIVWLILLKFKKIKINYLTFIISTWVLMFSILLTGLLPYDYSWTIPVRIIIVVIAYAASFFLLNLLMNKIIVNSKFAEQFAFEIIKEENRNKEYLSKNLSENFKKRKKQAKEIVEIEDDK